jgi:hypothetical protein
MMSRRLVSRARAGLRLGLTMVSLAMLAACGGRLPEQ